MTDLLSAIREFRFLEEKRRTGGLSGEDQERWDQLRVILGERAPAPSTASPPAAIGTPGNAAVLPQAAAWLTPAPAVAEEPPLVDADLLEDAPVAGPDPPMAAPPPAPMPAVAFAGWPAADVPAPDRSEPAEPPDALAGWPMTEEPVAAAPIEPPPAPTPWPMAEPPAMAPPASAPPAPAAESWAPPMQVPEAAESHELQSGQLQSGIQSGLQSDEALLSVTDFLVQAPLASAPSPWPTVPAPEPTPASLPWPAPVVVPAPPAAPTPPAPVSPPEPSAWFSPSPAAPPPVAPREPVPWPEPVARADRAVWPQRINTAPPWPATPAVPPAAAVTPADPDQDLPVAVEPVAIEPDAMALLSESPASEEKPDARRGVFIAGEHRVVVHTLVGALKRGTIHDLDLEAHTIELSPQAGGDPEWVNSEELKAIFFMLPPGQPHLAQAGQRLTVTFHDGRQITGFSSDYRPGDPGFFLVPADTRSATARIYVFRAALRDVMAN